MKTILEGFEAATDWIQPGNAGNSGGPSAAPNGVFTVTPAAPCVFRAKGASAYNNGYFYRVIPGAWDAVTHFLYKLKFMLPTEADLAACQAIEFELQQNVGSKIYNMAWQVDLKGTGLWRTFSYSAAQWVAENIPTSMVRAGEWADVEAAFLRGADCTLTHAYIKIDGVVYPVNLTRPATPKIESDYVHHGFQLDSNASATPYVCRVKDYGLSMW